MKKVYSLLVFINSCLLSAQSPNVDWQKTYGGNGDEVLYSINQTNDGGFIIGGSSTSDISGDKTVANNGNLTSDYWVIKTDAVGTIEWQKSIGGYGADSYTKIVQTSDAGYIIGGSSLSNISGDKTENCFGEYDYWVVKLDSFGNVLWDKTLGGNYNDIFENIIETTDGGFLVSGSSGSMMSGNKTENYVGYTPQFSIGAYDYWVVKLDASGNILWQNTIGGNGADELFDIINTPDGGYLIGGKSDSSITGDKTEPSRGIVDFWIVKLDNNGSILWDKTLGGNRYDALNALCNTNDNGYLLGGSSDSDISGEKTEGAILASAGPDMWVLKLDATGVIVWQKTIGGTDVDFLYTISKDSHGDFLLGGSSDSNISYNKTENSKGGVDFWIVKINSTGSILWDKTLGGEQNEGIYGMCYDFTDDSFVFGGPSLSSDSGDKTEVSRGLNDYWIVKLESERLSVNDFKTTTIQLYPNPTNKTVNINFPKTYKNINASVTNMLGQQIQNEQFVNTHEISFDLLGAKGVYFVKVSNEKNQSVTFKVLKQ